MTGMDVWHIIAPILADGLPMNRSDAQEVYLTTYWALKMYDKKKENDGDSTKSE